MAKCAICDDPAKYTYDGFDYCGESGCVKKCLLATRALLAYLDSDDVFLIDRPTGNCSGRQSEKLARLLKAARQEVKDGE